MSPRNIFVAFKAVVHKGNYFPTQYIREQSSVSFYLATCLPPIRVCLARSSRSVNERVSTAGGWQSFRGGRHAQPGYCQGPDFRPDHVEASTEPRRQWLPVYYAGRRLIRSQRVRAILNKSLAEVSLVKEQQISDAFGAFSRGANQPWTFTTLFRLHEVSLARRELVTLELPLQSCFWRGGVANTHYIIFITLQMLYINNHSHLWRENMETIKICTLILSD